MTVLFLRFLLAGALMTALMAALKLPWPRGRNLAVLIALGAIGYVGQSFCYFSALRQATAGLTALLLYLYPALVTLASAALGRQRLTWSKAALAGLSLLGVLLTVARRFGRQRRRSGLRGGWRWPPCCWPLFLSAAPGAGAVAWGGRSRCSGVAALADGLIAGLQSRDADVLDAHRVQPFLVERQFALQTMQAEGQGLGQHPDGIVARQLL